MDYVVIVLEVGCNEVALHEGSDWSGMRLDHAQMMTEEGKGEEWVPDAGAVMTSGNRHRSWTESKGKCNVKVWYMI